MRWRRTLWSLLCAHIHRARALVGRVWACGDADRIDAPQSGCPLFERFAPYIYAIMKLGLITRRSEDWESLTEVTSLRSSRGGGAAASCVGARRGGFGRLLMRMLLLPSWAYLLATTAAARSPECVCQRAKSFCCQSSDMKAGPMRPSAEPNVPTLGRGRGTYSMACGCGVTRRGQIGTMSRGRPSERSLPPVAERCSWLKWRG